MIPGRATAAGTAAFATRHPEAAPGHFRLHAGLTLSSLGLGTYLGESDDETDARVTAAALDALGRGLNVLDSAINYRCQRGERALGVALREAAARGIARREEVFVATKGGFVPFEGEPPGDPAAYVQERFIRPGLVKPGELVAGCHCMTRAYLADQLERSRRNLGVETIDLYMLHNPETQLGAVSRDEFMKRLRAAFEFLEGACDLGLIAAYGTATWNGLRAEPDDPAYLPLTAIAGMAAQVGGAGHRFRAVQLPHNLAMPEAYTLSNQPVARGRVTLLEAAVEHGLAVMTSASLLQGKLVRELPAELARLLPGPDTDAQRALQFARSSPGVTTALAGMSRPEHVRENAALVRVPPATPAQIRSLFKEAP